MYDQAAVKPVIIERLANGEFLEDICTNEGMPTSRAVRHWLINDADFFRQCAKARAESAASNEREVVRLIAKVVAGDLEPDAARVAINAHTWLAKVRNPKVYGDRLEVEQRITITGAVMDRLERATGRLIEGEATRQEAA